MFACMHVCVYASFCCCLPTWFFFTVSHLSARMYLEFYKKNSNGWQQERQKSDRANGCSVGGGAGNGADVSIGLALVFVLSLALGTLQLTSRVCLLARLLCVSFSYILSYWKTFCHFSPFCPFLSLLFPYFSTFFYFRRQLQFRLLFKRAT